VSCFRFLFGTLTSLLEDELLVILWTDIFAFSLHVKLLLNCFTLCENLMLELIDELILLVTHLKYYDEPNCDLIKI